MKTLSDEHRSALESTVREARQAAEIGARKALSVIDVARPEAGAGLAREAQSLRRRLRAHARQLGDARDPDTGAQSVDRLVREVAYQHWHRMLFARFLAENGLLIEPMRRVAVTLEEVADLARESGQEKWGVAASYAQGMLPAIFDGDSPALAVNMPPEARQTLEKLVAGLEPEIFRADDALGWTYQYWQSDEKQRVNKAGGPIGADELPCVTQLFTEHYMVEFLLHNTIGAWFAGKLLAVRPQLAKEIRTEGDLRAACALPGYGFEYLRFIREGDPNGDIWRIGAGAFRQWPRAARDLTVLDPCCGSGHFLVAAFDLLVRLRMHEEGLALGDAIAAVLRENLFGLELDARCVQIAVFAVALHAWKWLGAPTELPRMHVACCGLAAGASRDEWVERAGGNARLREGMGALHDLLAKAPMLGSLIDPPSMAPGDLLTAGLHEVGSALVDALEATEGPEGHEAGIAARGMLDAVALLQRRYTLVLTNPPYLGLERMGAELREHLVSHWAPGHRDLATAFIRRTRRMASANGARALVLPSEWTYNRPNRKLRAELVGLGEVCVMDLLGPESFSSQLRVSPALVVFAPTESASAMVMDVSAESTAANTAAALQEKSVCRMPHAVWSSGIDTRFLVEIVGQGETTSGPSPWEVRLGMTAGDWDRFGRCFWEVIERGTVWDFVQSSVSKTCAFGGRSGIFRWEAGRGEISRLAQGVKGKNHAAQNWRRGMQAWGRQGIVMSQMGALECSRYTGEPFDNRCMVIVPRSERDLGTLLNLAFSGELARRLRQIDRGRKIASPQTVLQAAGKLDDGGFAGHAECRALPQSNDPTQWLFHGHPAGMVAAGSALKSPLAIGDPGEAGHDPTLTTRSPNPADLLQVTVARLVGYRWPAELDPGMRLDASCRYWADRCSDLRPLADDDGVVPIPALRGELGAADRVEGMLRAALSPYGRAVDQALIRTLLAESGSRCTNLGDWLRDDFFEQHCSLFDHRPFVWHIWDGRSDGFQALVSYHRLAAPNGEGRRLLEKLIHTYLGEWIDRQRAEKREGRDGADARVEAALRLQQELEAILVGEEPRDIFVRWKPLAQQPIGWDPDLNDGIRRNIRPFLMATRVGRKGAGVLRAKPGTLRYTPDLGVDPDIGQGKGSFPWLWGFDAEAPAHRTDFAGGASFDGRRWNDVHYSLKAKRASRGSGGGT